MSELHRYVAYTIPAGFALMVLWVIVSLVRNRTPGDRFWGLLAGLQVVLGIQAAIGVVLFALGLRPQSNGPSWLHYVYGALFPLFILVVAHRVARRFQEIPWVVFGVAAFVNFGLTFRALQTGLGID